jgi:SSS family solute:Na+ symporter
MWVLHGSTLVMGALSIGAAVAMIQVKTALDAWWKLAGIFSGGMLGLFLLGILSRRAQSKHAAMGVGAGVVVIAWMTFSPLWRDAQKKAYLLSHPELSKEELSAWWNESSLSWLASPFHDNLIIVAGTLTILAVGLLLSRFSERQIREVRTDSSQESTARLEPSV